MYKGSSSWPHVNFPLRIRKVNTENSGHCDQWKTCKIHYLPPRALNGTTWIPRGPPSLGTCTSFTISLWDNGWMREHEHGRSTKPKQKQNKSRQNTDTHTTEQNQTKTPPGDRHPGTHSEAQAWWRRQHWRRPTRMLVWWHGGSSHQRQLCCKGHRRGPRGPFSSEQNDFMITQHPNVLLEKS